MPSTALSRRRFLAQSSLAAASTLGFPAIVSCKSPNEKLNLVFIGTGGRGASNIKETVGVSLWSGKGAQPKEQPGKDSTAMEPSENVVGLCDVNGQNLDRAKEVFHGARAEQDFRRLYDRLQDSEFDAVVVSTTEHTHAYAVLPALLRKKPVYCEKPLTRDVHEARVIREAAAKAGVPTQMGTQMHATANYHRVVELVQSGAIGKVTECHVWVSRAWGLQSKEAAEANKDIIFVTDRPKEEQTPPPYLNWDLWLGPAPYRPFHEVYFPGPKWYRWWDFGNGTMSDLGSHWNDLPWWALKLDAPLTIESKSDQPAHPEIAPASMTAVYEYGPRGDLPACRLTWHQGVDKPEIWKTDPRIQQSGNGVLFIGDKGMLLADYSKHVLLPEDKFKDFTPPAPFIPDSPGQQKEWLNAIRNGTPTGSPFDTYAGPLTEANHLGNVAFRAGKKLEWDAANMKIKNAPEAERFLKREPRKGWSLG